MGFVMELSEWHTPATDYPLTQQGNVRLKHSYYAKENGYNLWGVQEAYLFIAKKRMRLTVLQEQLDNGHWRTWMIDDPPQWLAMTEYAKELEGNILCVGLGLGLMIHAIRAENRFKSVTVIESNLDVIKLITPLLPEYPPGTLRIIWQNFYDYAHMASQANFDWILLDIWTSKGMKEKIEVHYQALRTIVELKEMGYKGKIIIHGCPDLSDAECCQRWIDCVKRANAEIGRGEYETRTRKRK